MRILACLHIFIYVCMYGDGPLQRADAGQREWESGSKRHVLRICRNVHSAFIAVQAHI